MGKLMEQRMAESRFLNSLVEYARRDTGEKLIERIKMTGEIPISKRDQLMKDSVSRAMLISDLRAAVNEANRELMESGNDSQKFIHLEEVHVNLYKVLSALEGRDLELRREQGSVYK